MTETIYLFKSPNGTYYTCLCLPKVFRDGGFPFDIKVSLLTKERAVATSRNAAVVAQLHSILHHTCTFTDIGQFTREFLSSLLLSTSMVGLGGHKFEYIAASFDQQQSTILPLELRHIEFFFQPFQTAVYAGFWSVEDLGCPAQIADLYELMEQIKTFCFHKLFT